MIQVLPRDKTYWALVPTVLYHCVPLLQSYITGYMPFFFFIIWLILERAKFKPIRRDARERRYFSLTLIFYMIYQFVPSFYWLFGHGDLRVPMAQALNSIALFMVLYVSLRREKYRELIFLLTVACLGLSLAGITAFRLRGMENIQGARDVMGAGATNLEQDMAGRYAMSLGLGGYTFMYICAFIVPSLLIGVFLVKNKLLRIGLLILSVLLLYCIRTGGLGTPVFVCVFGIACVILWLISRSVKIMKICSIIGIVLMTVFITKPECFSFLSVPFEATSNSMEKGQIQYRFETLANLFKGDRDSYAYGRYNLQRRSYNTFCENPICGVGAFSFMSTHENSDQARWKVGGHSYFLDMLAYRGLLGSLPFYLFVYFLFKYFNRLSVTLLGSRWMSMCYVYLAVYIFAGIANPVPLFPATFYLMLPAIAICSKYRDLLARTSFLLRDRNVDAWR